MTLIAVDAERVVRKTVHLPERTGLQVRPVVHAWVRRSRM